MRDLSRVRLWNSSVERQRFESKTTRRRARPQLKRKPLQRGRVRRLLRVRVLLGTCLLMERPRLRVRVLLGMLRLRVRVLLKMHRLMERLRLRVRVLLGMHRLRVGVLLQTQSLVRLQPERVLQRVLLQRVKRLQRARRQMPRQERLHQEKELLATGPWESLHLRVRLQMGRLGRLRRERGQ